MGDQASTAVTDSTGNPASVLRAAVATAARTMAAVAEPAPGAGFVATRALAKMMDALLPVRDALCAPPPSTSTKAIYLRAGPP